MDQVRELRREASLSPVMGRHRIFIICGMEFANENAANALLKILEEPPSPVIFLLTATSGELVAPTIVSRCQVLFLHPQPKEMIQRALEEHWGVPGEQARLLAGLSGGRMGRALALLQQANLLAKRQEALAQLRALLPAHWGERFTMAADLARRPEQIPEILEVWLSWWRDLLLVREGLREHMANVDCERDFANWSNSLDVGAIREALVSLQACADYLQKNVGTRLALEWLMLHLPLAGEPA